MPILVQSYVLIKIYQHDGRFVHFKGNNHNHIRALWSTLVVVGYMKFEIIYKSFEGSNLFVTVPYMCKYVWCNLHCDVSSLISCSHE